MFSVSFLYDDYIGITQYSRFELEQLFYDKFSIGNKTLIQHTLSAALTSHNITPLPHILHKHTTPFSYMFFFKMCSMFPFTLSKLIRILSKFSRTTVRAILRHQCCCDFADIDYEHSVGYAQCLRRRDAHTKIKPKSITNQTGYKRPFCVLPNIECNLSQYALNINKYII